MRRVLVLASWFPCDAHPGLGSFVLEQAQALRRHCGLDVRVVSGRPMRVDSLRPWRMLRDLRACARAQREATWRDHDGVPVLDVPYAAGTPLPLVSNARAYAHAISAAAVEVHRHFAFDVVHAHTAYLDGTAALALRTRFGVSCVVTEHTGPFSDLMRRPWTRATIRRALLGADRALAVSNALANEIRRWMPAASRSRIGVLRNGVDAERLVPPARWTPDPGRPRLAAIGVFRAVKAPEVLLAAFAELLRTLPGATLQLVGDGELVPVVRSRCKELGLDHAVRCRGTLDRAAIATFLRDDCDVVVISSRTETFGLAAVEALACGKPVVSTRCGGPEEIIDDPALGRLCAVDDAPALAAALRDVCAELPRFDPVAIRQSVVRRFALADVAHELQGIYDEVAVAQARRQS